MSSLLVSTLGLLLKFLIVIKIFISTWTIPKIIGPSYEILSRPWNAFLTVSIKNADDLL